MGIYLVVNVQFHRKISVELRFICSETHTGKIMIQLVSSVGLSIAFLRDSFSSINTHTSHLGGEQIASRPLREPQTPDLRWQIGHHRLLEA